MALLAIDNVFEGAEFDRRRDSVQRILTERDWGGLIVARPENVYYLCGLNFYGYFSATLLLIPREGEPLLFARAMEAPTIERQCHGIKFVGLAEDDNPVDIMLQHLADQGLTDSRIAVELDTMSLPAVVAFGLRERLADHFADGSGVVDDIRNVMSPVELDFIRDAGKLSETIAEAAFAAARPGVSEREVAAAAFQAMIAAGGDPSAFPPLIRSTETILLSHTSWRDRELKDGDALLVEVAGSVERYHAPHTRLGYIGRPPREAVETTKAAIAGIEAIAETIKPGVAARDVFAAWVRGVEAGGLPNPPLRHHSGYITGIGFPPSWMTLKGGSRPVSLRPSSSLVLEEGMVFHIFSWMLKGAPGMAAISDTAIVTADGCEVVTKTSREVRHLG